MVENNSLVHLALSVLSVLIPALAAMVVELIRRKLGIEKMVYLQQELCAKQDLGVMAVRFAEQAYRSYGGEVKYNAAAQYLSQQAKHRGLNISEKEIRALIESSLRSLKENFSETWAKVTEPGEEEAAPVEH